ncbi:hypothetical protein [Stenomitos frigidus]|uniref:hypothetical protein n=1 Tax=Stenomitos frigidus TaxID=1886765 RepID=UPI001C62CF66|nr:hypothetical protein [Stenomitos frigidus]
MVIGVIPDVTIGFIDPTYWFDTTYWLDLLQPSHWHLPIDLAALGDKKIEVDLAGDVQKAFNNFVKTGQVWAFLIGIIFGYFVKTFTSFG